MYILYQLLQIIIDLHLFYLKCSIIILNLKYWINYKLKNIFKLTTHHKLIMKLLWYFILIDLFKKSIFQIFNLIINVVSNVSINYLVNSLCNSSNLHIIKEI